MTMMLLGALGFYAATITLWAHSGYTHGLYRGLPSRDLEEPMVARCFGGRREPLNGSKKFHNLDPRNTRTQMVHPKP